MLDMLLCDSKIGGGETAEHRMPFDCFYLVLHHGCIA